MKGATISYDGSEKQLQATFAADSGVYCVVSDTNTTPNDALSDSKTTSIVLDHAALGLNSGWDDLKGISSLGGTINIASGASLSSANLQATAATRLDGAGQYIISSPGSAISNLGSNVSLADTWTGVVTVSGGHSTPSSAGSALSNLAKSGNSTIEFKGFSGYDNVSNAWKGTMAYNVKLTNVDNTVAWSNNAWVSVGDVQTGTFTGKWSGEGTFMANVGSGHYQNYKYTGDISGWTGEFRLNNGTTKLTFSGDANDVKIGIGKTAGTLNLAVECTSKITTMSGSVSVDKVTVAATSLGLKYTGSGMSLTSLEGTLTIGSTGVVNGPADGALSLGTGSDSTVVGKILIDVGGSFSSEGMKYTTNGQQATIAGNGQESLDLLQGSVSISNALIEKTAAGNKDIAIALTNVALKVSNGTTTLNGDKQQTLSKVTVGSGSTVKMENTHDESSVTLVEGGGRFETTRNFTGTLAGGAGATLTAKLAGTTQTGTVVKVDASVGSVDLLNTSSVTVTVTDMVIGAGQTVGVYTGDSAVANPSSRDEGSVTLTKLKVDGTGATLNANLKLNTGGTLTLNGTLAMGSTLTLGSGITLSGSLLTAWQNDKITLFSGVDSFNGSAEAASVVASDLFSNSELAEGSGGYNYKVLYGGGDNAVVELVRTASDTPEPTTATLSLLALMGLAARRRRKAAK